MKRLNKKKLMRGELHVDQNIWMKRVMEGTDYGYDPRISLEIRRKPTKNSS